MRIAIVTGASRGLGEALCLRLRDSGYEVVDFSRTAPHPFSTPLDLSSPATASHAASVRLSSMDPRACSELLLFSNAGTLWPIGPTWRKPRPDVVANLSVNFVSAIAVLTEAIRHFRDSSCRKVLVNISSGAALKGYAGWSLYCASKAGMEGFVRALAVEEQHQACPFIAVSVDPGVIDTDMQSLIRATSAFDFPEVERFAKRKHGGGLAAPDAVALAIIKLVNQTELNSGTRYVLPP